MKRLVLCLVAGAAAIGAVLGGSFLSSQSAHAPGVVINSGAAESAVSEAINQAASYNPKVACPREIVGEKGTVFRCEALVRGQLVPVDLKIISPLGFIRVVNSRALRQLEEERRTEEQEAQTTAECENINVSAAARRAERRCLREATNFGR